jgi:Arc/MetJ family transcription regulator
MKTTRTNIVLRDDLLKDIMRLSEAKTKREAVENALEMHVQWLKRQKLASLRGKIEWEGDLMEMRKGSSNGF